jgi:hypothetical protein
MFNEQLQKEYLPCDLPTAMTAFMNGKTVLVDWDCLITVKKDKWCELNINHLQRGQWYIKVSE